MGPVQPSAIWLGIVVVLARTDLKRLPQIQTDAHLRMRRTCPGSIAVTYVS